MNRVSTARERDAMPQAIVDPEELRRFAQNLRKFSGEVQDRVTSLGAQMVALERTWRDQEQKKFAEEFEQHMRTIARFVEVIEHHIPYLQRKAEIIDEYLQQR
jgi:WXG100 family type VII secretion target